METDSHWQPEAEMLPSRSSEHFWHAQLRLHHDDGIQGLVTRPVSPLRLLNPHPLPVAVALPSGRYYSSGKSPSGWSPGQPEEAATCCARHDANANVLPFQVRPAFGSGNGSSTLLQVARDSSRQPGSHHDDNVGSMLVQSAINCGGTHLLAGSGSGHPLDNIRVLGGSNMTVPPCRQLWRRESCSESAVPTMLASWGTSGHHGGNHGAGEGTGCIHRCSEPAPHDGDSKGAASLPVPCRIVTTNNLKIACHSACQPRSHHPLAGSKRSWSSSLVSHDGSNGHPMSHHGDSEVSLGQGQGLDFESALSTLPMPLSLGAADAHPTGSDSTPMRRLSHWADGLAAMIAMEQAQQSQATPPDNDCNPQMAMIAMEQAHRLRSQPAPATPTHPATGSHTSSRGDSDDGSDLCPRAERDPLAVTSAEQESARQDVARQQSAWQEAAVQHQLAHVTATAPPTRTPHLPLAQRLALLVRGSASCDTGKRVRICQPAYRPALDRPALEERKELSAAAAAESRSEVQCEVKCERAGAGMETGRQVGKGTWEGRREAVLAADWRAQWRRQRGTAAATSASLETRAVATATVATARALARRRQCESREGLSKLRSVISQSAIRSYHETAVPRDNPHSYARMHEPDKASLLLAAAAHIRQLQERKEDLIGQWVTAQMPLHC